MLTGNIYIYIDLYLMFPDIILANVPFMGPYLYKERWLKLKKIPVENYYPFLFENNMFDRWRPD